jgi:hypothetical protein
LSFQTRELSFFVKLFLSVTLYNTVEEVMIDEEAELAMKQQQQQQQQQQQ